MVCTGNFVLLVEREIKLNEKKNTFNGLNVFLNL